MHIFNLATAGFCIRNSFLGFSILCFALFLTPACNPGELSGDYEIELHGFIEEQEITTYQYGTHTIFDGELYALHSDSIDLDKYVGKEVTLGGTFINSGISGGPKYIEVLEIVK